MRSSSSISAIWCTWWHDDTRLWITISWWLSESYSQAPCVVHLPSPAWWPLSMTTQYDQAGWGCQGQGGILWSPAQALTSPCLYCLTCFSWSASSWIVGTLGKYIQYCNFLDSQNNPVFHIVDDMIIPAARPGPDQPSLECSVVAAQW